MPIVCVNVDGYYDNFMTILQRAHDDELLYKHPTEIVHFESTSEAAVLWVEQFLADPDNVKKGKEVKRRSYTLKRAESNISGNASAWGRMASFFGDTNVEKQECINTSHSKALYNNILVFVAGLSVGILVATKSQRSK
jgi:hypothetical protein